METALIKRMSRLALMASGLFLSAGLEAHSGGTNAEGCHTNRSTGEYHCHGPKPAPRATLASSQPASPARGTSYANCAEARAAGAAPVRRGQPGYGRHLDRDNDGVGCE